MFCWPMNGLVRWVATEVWQQSVSTTKLALMRRIVEGDGFFLGSLSILPYRTILVVCEGRPDGIASMLVSAVEPAEPRVFAATPRAVDPNSTHCDLISRRLVMACWDAAEFLDAEMAP